VSEAAELSAPSELPEGAACAMHPEAGAAFVCKRCGSFACEELCAFSKLEGREVCRACASKGLGEPIPWERRKAVGSWRAFWQTVRLVTRKPAAFFRTPTTDGSVLGSVVHGTLSYTIGLVLTYCTLGLTMMLGSGGVSMVSEDVEAAGPIGAFLGAYGCTILGAGPIFALMSIPNALLSIVIAAGVSHGVLALFKKTKGSFEDTLRAVSYANAPYVWSWIPVFGGLIAYVWVVWVEVIAVRETHRCGTDMAVLATVGYRVVFFVLVVTVYALFIGGLLMLDPNQQ
jgi:hypothetical protein